MKRKVFLAVAVVALLAMAATSASALSRPRLSFVKSGGATIGWSTTGGSSPADTGNGSSLRINAPEGGGVSAYTYGASETLVGIRGRSLSQIDRLGFDSHGYLGNGAPRISLGTTGDDGDHTYFLSAFYCNDPLTGGWRTSDFVNDTTDCTIWRDGTTEMTWAAAVVIADANNEVVQSTPNDWFLIVDESPAVLNVDRLTVQDWMWNRGGSAGRVNCNVGNCV